MLYVCPIRALLNNQEERLRSYGRMVGVEVFKWHGDVSDSKKKSFRSAPAHILMTTPESLEVMLMSARTNARTLFGGLAAVVIDEVHAFAGDDRGAHLASLLERLTAMTGTDIQRIGLSATVGNPHVIGAWLQGSSKRRFRLVDPPKGKTERDLRIEMASDIGDAALGITKMARGKKSLVFVESRSKAERVAAALGGSGVEVFIHHSSVSRADRTLAEEQFACGHNTAIVCTSTMELGIDVGDLDQVIQVDAPSTVASFLQRMGRTGRRDGARANCTFFCLSPESLLQSVALLRLVAAGWVEDVRPAAHALHVLAHQILALTLQESGISRHRLLPWVEAAYPFSTVRAERLHELVDTMVEREILDESDAVLSLGRRGEKLYGRKNFFELYAVFTAPPILRVVHGKEDVGHIQATFLSSHDFQEGPLCFRLAGRAWETGLIEWGKGVVHVKVAQHGRVPSWLGMPGTLSTRLCQTMRDALLEAAASEATWLSPDAARDLAGLRGSYEGLFEAGLTPLEEGDDEITWHTFAGGAVNRLLAAGLERTAGKKWLAGNLSVRCKGLPVTAARDALRGLHALDWETVAREAAGGMARGVVSKFQPCLPKDAEDRLLAERLLDLPGTLAFLGQVVVGGERLARSPTAVRLVDRIEDLATPVAGHAPRGMPAPATPRHEIMWVDTADALTAACAVLARAERMGLDVETALDFGTLCLLQVAVEGRTFVIDPFAVGDLGPLAGLLASPAHAKLIHNASFERRVLASVGVELEGVIDTLELSREVRGLDAIGGHSLATVCERELGLLLDKSEQTSNWARRPLTEEQLRYAALDAEVLLTVYDQLARIRRSGGGE
ncbi:MAG: DEAD/DEAH box helicase [Polyangiaceae bacterium]|nr:DEAD/DEAH box helicase [Polyangiaceae bacterium]